MIVVRRYLRASNNCKTKHKTMAKQFIVRLALSVCVSVVKNVSHFAPFVIPFDISGGDGDCVEPLHNETRKFRK